MIIKMDDREKLDMESFANEVDKDLLLLRVRMNEGDYVFEDVVIERKTIDDFCNSIIDGRLSEQVKKMKSKYSKCFVIIVGGIKERTCEIHENCVLGKIASLVAKHEVKVLMVENERQFIWIMKTIFGRILEERDRKLVEDGVNEMLEEVLMGNGKFDEKEVER